jgi:hypothetical protein
MKVRERETTTKVTLPAEYYWYYMNTESSMAFSYIYKYKINPVIFYTHLNLSPMIWVNKCLRIATREIALYKISMVKGERTAIHY